MAKLKPNEWWAVVDKVGNIRVGGETLPLMEKHTRKALEIVLSEYAEKMIAKGEWRLCKVQVKIKRIK